MPIEFTEIHDEHPSDGAVEHMVRMRDGVRLATDVYLPEGWTDGPTVLTRLPYDKSSRYVFFSRIAALLNERGYAVVVQDVRGKYRSEGETLAFVNETHDGYDTLDWIVGQPWSNGKVGMFGDSYYGFTQWAAVASEHPALRAIVPRVTGADIGNRSILGVNADGRSRRVKTMWQPLYLSQIWVDNHSYDYVPDFSLRPVSAVFEDAFASIGKRSAYLDMLVPHPIPARIFPGPHPFDTKPLPVLHVAGWFDNLKDQSIKDYLTLAARPAWAPLQYLWVDSIDHENYRLADVPVSETDDHGVNDEALGRMLGDYVGPAADFFDVFLAETAPVDGLPRVRWHLGHGPDHLQDADRWPPAGVETLELYLGDASAAASGASGGVLVADVPPPSAISWTHDPDDLVPSTVTNPFAMLFEYADESRVHHRADVLTFSSAPTEEPLDLVGGVELTLTVASTAPSTDVIAKLFDVAPDGAAHLVAWGDAQIETVGGAWEFTVDLGQVAYRLRDGHALRVQVASSEFPAFQPHPGVMEPAWTATEWRTSEQTMTTSATTSLRLSVLRAPDELTRRTDRSEQA